MWRRPALAALLVVAACSPAPAPQRSTAPIAPSSSGAQRLSSALSDMYASRYTVAQREFAALLAASPRDADAVASFALFLNYTGKSDPAQSEAALATAVAPTSAYAYAVLCRVNDWAAQYESAVTAGRRAIQLSPSQPLAHLFLSEALADTGQLVDAQAQIDAARPLIDAQPTPYLKAELLRETGNLAGDRGDDAGHLDSFKSANAQQPGWLYRTSEVVEALSGANDAAAARQTLETAAATAPEDPLVLAQLGADAISIGDSELANTTWAEAARLAPSDPDILVAAGEVQVAVNHDFNAATADFQAALRADPANLQAAGYLMALARYVHRDPESGRAAIAAAVGAAPGRQGQRARTAPDPDARIQADAQRALDDVNAARRAAALPPVHLDSRLAASAESHSYYWLFNNLSPTVSGLGIHEETAGLTGYSGSFPWTRAVAHGYPNQRIGEDIDHRGDPVKAVDEWVNSVFHRFAIVRADLEAVGYGAAAAGPLLMEDLEFGFGPESSAGPVLYPGSGQSEVPAMFVDNELPDPVPAGQPRTTGSPVTVTFAAADSVQVTSFTLQDSSGHALSAYTGIPSDATENSAWLLPHSVFTPSSAYTAHIVARINGHSYDRSWTFTTAG